MLSTRNKQINSIFERVVTDKNGILVRVRFTITEVDGVMKGQIISVEPLVTENEEQPVKYLPVSISKSPQNFTYTSPFILIISPFSKLFFFNSQPTRAPAL